MVDVYNRLCSAAATTGRRVASERRAIRCALSRMATVLVRGRRARRWRATCRGSAALLEIANKLINAFTGPLFGIFLLAMFSRRATSDGGARRRASPARLTSYYVAYHTPIGFLWPSTFGLAATLALAGRSRRQRRRDRPLKPFA